MAKEKTLTEMIPQFLAEKKHKKWIVKHPKQGDAMRKLIDGAIENKVDFVKEQLKELRSK